MKRNQHMKHKAQPVGLSDDTLFRWTKQNVCSGATSHADMAAFIQQGLNENRRKRTVLSTSHRKRTLSHHRPRNIKYNLISGSASVTVPEGVRVTFNPANDMQAFLQKFSVFASSETPLRLMLDGIVVAELGEAMTFPANAHQLLSEGTQSRQLVVAVTEQDC